MKKLNIISAIIEFVFAAFFGGVSIEILYLMLIPKGEIGSGLLFLIPPIGFAVAIVFFILAIFNIKNKKNTNMLTVKVISIIEILCSICFYIYGLPLLIVSIIKLYLLPKIKKNHI